jgi:endonuclease III
MAQSRREKVAALLERHGRTYAEELGIDVRRGTPAPLFQLLVASLLFSARINTSIAVEAAKAVRRDGWTTARRLAESSWERRAKVLNEAGYARYDERTATMLGDTAALLLREYGGDLRRLRGAAGREPDEERRRLKRFKGIGDVGVDIFFREAQVAWEELRPFFDRRALETAERLGLGKDAPALARLVDDADVARLATALVRARQAGDLDELA